MPAKPDFPYTPKEMQKRVDDYFLDCENTGRKPTVPGLCLVLGITTRRYNALLSTYNSGGVEEGDRKAQKALQGKHLKILECARMYMCDKLEQNTDAMSKFRLKQQGYAGYMDNPETAQNDTIRVKITLDGIPTDMNPGA